MNSYTEKTFQSVINAIKTGDKQHSAYSAFENWAQYGVTKEQYTAVLPWLFDNDRNDQKQTVKGIGLIVPHKWIGEEPGQKMLFQQTGPAEIHRIEYVRDYVVSLYDKETGHAWNNSNPRYTIEDIVNGVCVNITEKA